MINQFPSQFFYCTSENFLKFNEPHIYGYGIFAGRIAINEYFDSDSPAKTLCEYPGAFTVLRRYQNKLEIIPDCNGFQPIFIYKKGSFWAFSNSFYLLASSLKEESHKLSLNYGYASIMLYHKWTLLLYDETMCKEIRLLDFNRWLRIDLDTGELNEIATPQISQVDPLSEAGIAIADEWLDKWAALVAGFAAADIPIMQELTGGKDSRVAFLPTMLSGVDLNSINIKCDNSGEDLPLCKKIGSRLGFEPNANPIERPVIESEVYESFWNYCRRGFTGTPFEKRNASKIYIRMTGYNGEPLRYHDDLYPARDFTKKMYDGRYGEKMREAAQAIFFKAHGCVLENYFNNDSKNDLEASYILYRASRSRLHFGSGMSMLLFSNALTLAPLADPALYKLDLGKAPTRDILFALLLIRAGQILSTIPFDGGRTLDPTAIELALWLNKRFPRKEIEIVPFNIKLSQGKAYDFSPCQKEWDFHQLAEKRFASVAEIFDKHFPAQIIEETLPNQLRHTYAMNCAIGIADFLPVSTED